MEESHTGDLRYNAPDSPRLTRRTMRTYLRLKNRQSHRLPAEFRDQDLRYPEELVATGGNESPDAIKGTALRIDRIREEKEAAGAGNHRPGVGPGKGGT